VDYRYLWIGSLFASSAQWLQLVSVGWLALAISGSVFHSIMTVAVRAMPTLLLGPWAGVLADRVDRRKLAMSVQVLLLVTSASFATLVALGQVTSIWSIYVYMTVTGVGFAVIQPLRQALVANTVRRADLGNALALNAMTATSTRLMGAAIAGILIETVDFHWNFYLEASLYLGMIALLIPMRTPYRETATARRASPLANLKEGIVYIWSNQVMRRLMTMNFVRTGVFMPLLLLLPSYTSQALDSGASVATAMIISMGIGGVAASFIISTWRFFTRKGLVGLISLTTGSAIILILGLFPWIWLAVPIMIFMGVAQTHFIVSNQTLIQTVVPDQLRGRVSSVWHYESGLIPLFSALIGVVAAFIGIATAMAWAGGVALGLCAIFLLRFKDVRALD
jgi:MFS family permease